MVFYFSKLNEENERSNRAAIYVSIDSDFPVLKVDVDLHSLPNIMYGSHEVVVDFHIDNFDNNKTFYTDSNGLEMQKRVLNYRPTWDLQKNYDEHNDNITANFYPVNSAVSIKDGHRKFTVMNDRAQAGTALEQGSI